MRKRFIAMLLAIVMIMACVVPAGAYSYDGTDSSGEASTIVTVDLDEGEDDSGSTGTETTGTETGLSEEAQAIQDMISALPAASDITIDNYEDVIAQLDAIDEAKLELYYAGNTEIDYLDYTKYDAACVAIEQIETDIANGVYDEEEEEGEDDGSTYVDPAEPETPETDPDVTEEEEQEEEQEEETVDYDQDAVDAFVNAYLTSENVTYPFDESVSDEDAVVYSEATEDNYEQILSGTDAWDALSEAEQVAVNAVITAAYIAANPDEFDGMSEEEIASFELTWDEMVEAAEALEEELADCDMEAVNDFINNYLTYEYVTYPFTEEQEDIYLTYLAAIEADDASLYESDDEYGWAYYVISTTYENADVVATAGSAWEALTAAEQNAVNDIIASYAELRGLSTIFTFDEIYETDVRVSNLMSLYAESIGTTSSSNSGISTIDDDEDIGADEEVSWDVLDTETYITGTSGLSTRYAYYSTQYYTTKGVITTSEGTKYYGCCFEPRKATWYTGYTVTAYKYIGNNQAFIASALANWFINGNVSSTDTDIQAFWGYDSSNKTGIWSYNISLTSNAAYAFMHELTAYFGWGESWKYSSYYSSSYNTNTQYGGIALLTSNATARLNALQTTANAMVDYIASNPDKVADLCSSGGVYIRKSDSTAIQDYVFVVTSDTTNPPEGGEPVIAYVTKSSTGNTTAVANAASGAYDLEGTVITIYSDSARTNVVGTLTVTYDSDSGTYISDTLELDAETEYFWKETTTGTGYNNSSNLNKTGSFTTGEGGTEYNIEIDNTPTVRYVRFTKATASGYSDIVSQGGDGNYSFTGAVITIYTDAACTNVYTTATIGSNGYTSSIAIPVGTTLYYKETKAPTGYQLNSSVGTITASTTANTSSSSVLTCTITETPITAKVQVYKTTASGYESWVNKNSCYSLEGTTIGVYKSYSDAYNKTNCLGVLTVGSNGYTGTLEVARNTTYYFRELTAGTGYVLSNSIKSATTGSSGTTTVTMENTPGTDPLTITLTKTGYDGTAQKSLAGAVFSVTYYAGYYTSESAAIAAGVESRTWYLQTVKSGSGYKAGFTYSGSLLTSGTYVSDELYTVDGVIVVPYGTIVIKEVQAAEGYLNDPTFTDSNGTSYGDEYIVKVTPDGMLNVKTSNSIDQTAFKVYDTLIPEISTTLTGTTGLSAHKAQASTSTTLTDTIDLTYLNDYVGKTVTIRGQLYYTDGTPVTVNGSNIVATQSVKITGTEQTVTQTFTFDASSLVGQEVVCYEEFIYNGESITDHSDPWDENQIVWFERLGPGSISVTKTDSEGNTLAGATYLLEYSTDDGTTWNPVYSYTTGAKDGYKVGGCSSSGLSDGMLTTGTDGVVTFSDLYADGSILYRLTEVQAPEGYTLLAESVYEGTLYVLADDSIDTTIYDVNGDGDITYADYRYLYHYVNDGGSAPASGTGDINKDGRINASDVTAIKTFLDDWTSGDTPFNRQFDIAYLVKDGSVFDMPLTGGNGTNWVPFVLAGMLGVMAGGAVFVLKRKKKDDELPTA